jgi:hypothetical protein
MFFLLRAYQHLLFMVFIPLPPIQNSSVHHKQLAFVILVSKLYLRPVKLSSIQNHFAKQINFMTISRRHKESWRQDQLVIRTFELQIEREASEETVICLFYYMLMNVNLFFHYYYYYLTHNSMA